MRQIDAIDVRRKGLAGLAFAGERSTGQEALVFIASDARTSVLTTAGERAARPVRTVVGQGEREAVVIRPAAGDAGEDAVPGVALAVRPAVVTTITTSWSSGKHVTSGSHVPKPSVG